MRDRELAAAAAALLGPEFVKIPLFILIFYVLSIS